MCDHSHSKSGCACNVQVKLDTKFKIQRTKDQRYKYSISNSCNGLLCLFNPFARSPLIVCNPITGEFINLPEIKKVGLDQHPMRYSYSFGFSPLSNQYKVIRMSARGTHSMAQVHILGTKTWKCIGFFTQRSPKLFPAYLNGFLYWSSDLHPLSVCTFDIERERFGSILAPSEDRLYLHSSVGVVRGEVCISRVSKSGTIHVWTMKDYGTEKAWSKVFSFSMCPYPTRYYGPFQPIKYLNDGAILMFHSYRNFIPTDLGDALLYIDSKRNRFRYLKIHGMESAAEVIAHTPSLVSLKHALSGQNVNVHNVMSRCTELKLHKEAKDISIVEEEFYPRFFFYASSDSGSDSSSANDSDSDSDSDSSSTNDSDSDSDSTSSNDYDFDSDSDSESYI
ncbi:F-box protein At3g07870-like isoform X2 [Euphorbia lathyris]